MGILKVVKSLAFPDEGNVRTYVALFAGIYMSISWTTKINRIAKDNDVDKHNTTIRYV